MAAAAKRPRTKVAGANILMVDEEGRERLERRWFVCVVGFPGKLEDEDEDISMLGLGGMIECLYTRVSRPE